MAGLLALGASLLSQLGGGPNTAVDPVAAGVATILAHDVFRPPIATTGFWSSNQEQLQFGVGVLVSCSIAKEHTHGHITAVFSVQLVHLKRQAVVYHLICGEDLVVVDFFFLDLLKNSGIVPRVLWMSQPLDGSELLTKSNNSSGVSGKLPIARDSCGANGPIPKVRYLVMEYFSKNLFQMFEDKDGTSFHYATVFGVQLIQLLKDLHSRNIVHGNINPGNIIFNDHEPLRLVDFKRASIKWDNVEPPTHCMDSNLKIEDLKVMRVWDTPWTAKGCVPSFRDDVYRAILVIAYMVHKSPFFDLFITLAQGTQDPEMKAAWIELRTNPNNIFNINTKENHNLPKDARVHLPLHRQGFVKRFFGSSRDKHDDDPVTLLFVHIAERALGMKSNDGTIPYNDIIHLLRKIAHITSP